MKLVHNTPIKKRYSLSLIRKRTKEESEMVQIKRETKRRTEKTESPERIYFLWFLSLKLLLEMEKLGMGFQKGKGGRTHQKEFIIGKDIKIDKDFYEDWDLDEVLTQPFYKWWRTHKNLFENPQTVEIDNLKGWTSQPHFRFLRIDLRNNYTTIMKDIRSRLEDLKGKQMSKGSQYPVYGKPRYENEIVTYNILVRQLNGEEDEDIFDNEKGRLQILAQEDKGQESKLWSSHKDFMKLKPQEREFTKKKVYRSQDRWKLTNKGYYKRWARTEGFRLGKAFYTALRTDINRYIINYQQILCGVAQGKYRKPVKF